MGKKTTLALAGSPDFTIWVKSSSDCRSTPRRLTPAGVSEIMTPQNFSRGFCRVTRTSCPEFMALAGLLPSGFPLRCCKDSHLGYHAEGDGAEMVWEGSNFNSSALIHCCAMRAAPAILGCPA